MNAQDFRRVSEIWDIKPRLGSEGQVPGQF
jgi:hypothetical protein